MKDAALESVPPRQTDRVSILVDAKPDESAEVTWLIADDIEALIGALNGVATSPRGRRDPGRRETW